MQLIKFLTITVVALVSGTLAASIPKRGTEAM